MKTKAATLLIKVKAHRGCPLNKEEDIRAEMGRMKHEKEKTWNTSTNRTINKWSEASTTKSGVHTTKQTAWVQTVRNRIRQKSREIQGYRTYEKGVEKWRKEHMPRKDKGNISSEGQEVLEDKEIWGNETVLHGAVYESRKRERSNEDRLFMPHQKGPITSTFTADWFLRNAWIHKITKGKESDRCDLCRALWTAEGRFRTEKDLPEQTLGHIQHTCEA